MTKDDILQMAHEAELIFTCPPATSDPLPRYVSAIERFAALVAAKAAAEENEACALISADVYDRQTAVRIIRARHNTKKDQQ